MPAPMIRKNLGENLSKVPPPLLAPPPSSLRVCLVILEKFALEIHPRGVAGITINFSYTRYILMSKRSLYLRPECYTLPGTNDRGLRYREIRILHTKHQPDKREKRASTGLLLIAAAAAFFFFFFFIVRSTVRRCFV